MPKSSTRFLRSLRRDTFVRRRELNSVRRELSSTHSNMSDFRRQALSHRIFDREKIQKNRSNIARELHSMTMKQPGQSKIHLAKPVNLSEAAVVLVALNHNTCCFCMGTGSVFRTKKNIRYSANCKSCHLRN